MLFVVEGQLARVGSLVLRAACYQKKMRQLEGFSHQPLPLQSLIATFGREAILTKELNMVLTLILRLTSWHLGGMIYYRLREVPRGNPQDSSRNVSFLTYCQIVSWCQLLRTECLSGLRTPAYGLTLDFPYPSSLNCLTGRSEGGARQHGTTKGLG